MKRYPEKCWICNPESGQETKLTGLNTFCQRSKHIHNLYPDIFQTNIISLPNYRALYIVSPLLLTFQENNLAHSHACFFPGWKPTMAIKILAGTGFLSFHLH